MKTKYLVIGLAVFALHVIVAAPGQGEKSKEEKMADLDGETGEVMSAAARSLVSDKELFLRGTFEGPG